MFRSNLIVFLSCFFGCGCYKILGVFPHPGKSHFDAFAPLLRTLNQRGHEVTVISHFARNDEIPGYKDISLLGTSKILRDVVPIDKFTRSRGERFTVAWFLYKFTTDVCEEGLKSKQMQEFIKGDTHGYDIVLSELFTTNCFLGLLHNMSASFIGLTSGGVIPWTSDYFGLPENPAYVSSLFMGFSDRMSFLERVQNSVAYVANRIMYKTLIDRHANQKARQYIKENLHDLDRFVYNASLLLVNNHFSIGRPRPVVPSVIEVGGLHLEKVKELPKNIEKWIKESPHGVIYFSMGSMIKGDTFPEEKRRAFLRAFGRLQQRVLWKWENDTMPEKPDNVMIQKWMPQFDILCHPNVKAFISHGGLLGTTEAVHCGVPTIVMPQYGDQFTNARALEASGGGIILDFSTATEEDVYNALRTALEPSFNKKTKELSERFRDRPMSPLDTAVYWVEYVARHKGAHHLKTAAVGMPLYQYLLLDVIAFLAVVVIAISYISFYITRAIFRKLFKKQSKVKKN